MQDKLPKVIHLYGQESPGWMSLCKRCFAEACIVLRDCVLRQKPLEAHPSKFCYLVFGSEKFKAKAQYECEEKPVMLRKITMKEKKCEAYLGYLLCSEGLTASKQATIKDRTARVKASNY